MNKINILGIIGDINSEQIALKQELINCDGLVSFKGLEWVRKGLKERSFNPDTVNNLDISYSLEDSRINIVCGDFTFSCTAYCFDGKSTFLMKDLRKAEGSGVEMMKDIIIDKILSDKKKNNEIGFAKNSEKFQKIVDQLSELSYEKTKALKELAKNHECVLFTKKDLKEQIIASSVEGEELRSSFDIEYLSYLNQIAVKNNESYPFVCKAKIISEEPYKKSSIDDYSDIATSFAEIRKGKGGAEKKMFYALVNMFTEPYWGSTKNAVAQSKNLIK